MKNILRFILLCPIALSSTIQTANADLLTSSQVNVSGFNQYPPNGGYGVELTYAGSSYIYDNVSSASLSNYQTTFTGMNSQGDTQTMTITASGTADAGAGFLKGSTTLTIDQPYWNGGNTAYVNQDFSTNSGGSLDRIELDSVSEFKDILTVNAAGTLSSLNVYLTLDGSISAGSIFADSPFYTQASVAVITDIYNDACYTCGSANLSGTGNYNQAVVLNIPVTDPNAVDLWLEMYLYNIFGLDSQNYDEGSSYTSTIDFSNTLQITGIQGLDSNGHTVTLNSVTGSSQDIYPIAATVPVPAAVWLFGSGLVGLVGIARRRRA